jgi:solute carrier family 41
MFKPSQLPLPKQFVSVSRKFNINPDNVATPVAASLGDLVTLAILSYSANILHNLDGNHLEDLLPG